MTVIELITLALKDIGVIGTGQTASAEDVNDSLTALNQLIEEWNLQDNYKPVDADGVRVPLATYATTADTITAAAGFQAAIRYSLGERIAPSYGVALRPDLLKLGTHSRRVYKRTNTKPQELEMPLELLPARTYSLIEPY